MANLLRMETRRERKGHTQEEIEDLVDRGAAPGVQVFNFGRLDYPDFWFRGEMQHFAYGYERQEAAKRV